MFYLLWGLVIAQIAPSEVSIEHLFKDCPIHCFRLYFGRRINMFHWAFHFIKRRNFFCLLQYLKHSYNFLIFHKKYFINISKLKKQQQKIQGFARFFVEVKKDIVDKGNRVVGFNELKESFGNVRNLFT